MFLFIYIILFFLHPINLTQSLHVSTLYTNLGDDAIVHGINETEVRTETMRLELVKHVPSGAFRYPSSLAAIFQSF